MAKSEPTNNQDNSQTNVPKSEPTKIQSSNQIDLTKDDEPDFTKDVEVDWTQGYFQKSGVQLNSTVEQQPISISKKKDYYCKVSNLIQAGFDKSSFLFVQKRVILKKLVKMC